MASGAFHDTVNNSLANSHRKKSKNGSGKRKEKEDKGRMSFSLYQNFLSFQSP